MRGPLLTLLTAIMALGANARADVITHIPTNDKVVALTFDACEAGQPMSFDRGILDYLLERELPFTVFASGRFVNSNRADVEALAALDFVEIENHSWSHPNHMNAFAPDAIVRQVQRAHEAIVEATGRPPQFFRFPAGNYNAEGLKAVEALGYKVVHWRWATGDPDARQSADAVKRTMANVRAGDVLIFHINGRGHHTAEALPRIVEQLEAEGYRFVLLSDYLGRPRPPLEVDEDESFTITSARRMLERWLVRAPMLGVMGAWN